MELGIALDGSGRLGQPAAVTAVAGAADQLGYGSVWCIGPWAATLVGAVAAVTTRVRIGIESLDPEAVRTARSIGGDRVVAVERLQGWYQPTDGRTPGTPRSGPVRIDVHAGSVADATAQITAAKQLGVIEVVVHLLDDPGTDEALATYAELGELAEGSTTSRR